MASFIELHCHTEYSNLRLIDSTDKVNATIDHAVQIGLRGLAITDHEALSGHLKAMQKAKRVRETYPDFQLILGNEIYLCHDSEPWEGEDGKVRYTIESPEFYHFILLAKDSVGHHQLRELSTAAWSRRYHYKGTDRVPTFYSDIERIVGANGGHLIASTACLGGELPKLFAANNVEGAVQFVEWCQKMFGADNFFIELQPGRSEEQIKFNDNAVRFCKHFGLKWIITNDVHYLTREKRALHEIYLQSHEEEREVGDFYESTYFKTEEEMRERMSDYLSADDIETGLRETANIGDMCKNAGDYGLFHTTIIPQRPLPPFEIGDGFAPFYDQCPSLKFCSTSPYEQDRFCLAEIEKGARAKNIPFTLELAERIDVELEQVLAISEQLGQRMTSYYNLVQYVVKLAWDVSIVGNGRGSACGFMLCYLMDITQVDSMKWNLPWWRHAHHTKVELADVDEDFSPIKIPAIFDKLREEFGADRCLNIITFKHESSKAAVGTACRGLGIDSDIAREISSMIPIKRGKVWKIDECLHGTEDNGYTPLREFINRVAQFPMLLETMQEIEGLVSGRSSHASGFYIFNQPFLEQNSLMIAPNGMRTTCWEMHDSDDAGALKVDLLVTDAVQKMQLCLDLLGEDGYIEPQETLKATYDKYLHPLVIDYESDGMWEMARRGQIVDLFQFDSICGSDAIIKTQPRNLKELSLANSAMRLMGNEDMVPLDRYSALKGDISLWYQEMRHNGLTDDEMHVLEKYLLPNNGCCIEQEDMMEIVMDEHISGFDMVQCNNLKKGVSKKIDQILVDSEKLFFEQGLKIGTRKQMLDYVWKYCVRPQLG